MAASASALGPGPTFVAADLSTDDAATALGAALDLGRPTLAIVEAVTMYLDEAVVRRQLAGLAEALAPGSRLAVNVLPATSPDSGRNRRQLRLQRLARTGTDEHYRCRLDPDAARELLEACGWTVREQITFAEAAERFVPRSTRLPIEAVDPRKTCWLATLPG